MFSHFIKQRRGNENKQSKKNRNLAIDMKHQVPMNVYEYLTIKLFSYQKRNWIFLGRWNISKKAQKVFLRC